MAKDIFNPDLKEMYGLDIIDADIKNIYDVATGINSCKNIILYIMQNFPNISQKMMYRLNAYSKLQGSVTFNKLPVITFKLN